MPKSKKQKTPKAQNISVSKTAKASGNPDWYLKQRPTWSFCRIDYEYLPEDIDWQEDIIKKLGNYEGMTWAEIMQASGGRKSGTNNHFDNVSNLANFAQKRWTELHLEEYDQVFSLRLTGEKRIFGILTNAILKIIWYDKEHCFYPMSK